MSQKNPYQIIKHRYVTEKATVLENLKDSVSSRCLARYDYPKYVFVVDRKANKREIATALEEIYHEKKVKVIAVNTIQVKGKRRRVRGRTGRTSAFKKAIVTFEKEDKLDNI